MAQKYWQRSGAIRKRKGSKIRKSSKRRLNFGRNVRISRSSFSRGVHRFRRFAFDSTVAFTTNGSGNYFGVIFANGINNITYGPAAASMPSVTEFTALFDQYKVLSYTVEIRPRYNSVEITNDDLPTIYYAHDTDSYTTPGTVSEIMERRNVHAKRLNRPVYLTVKFPCIQQMIYQSGVSTSYGPKKAPWLDMQNYSVPMAGIQYVIVGLLNTTYKFDIRVRWNFLCKNQR